MACSRSSSISFFILTLFTVLISPVISSRVSSFMVTVESRSSVASYCESWRLAVEANNAVTWKVIPSKCVSSLEIYYNGGQFDKDYEVVARYALAFANTVNIGGDGKDAWVFDVDETLLSNLEYYKAHGYGSEPFDSKKFYEWVVQGTASGSEGTWFHYHSANGPRRGPEECYREKSPRRWLFRLGASPPEVSKYFSSVWFKTPGFDYDGVKKIKGKQLHSTNQSSEQEWSRKASNFMETLAINGATCKALL